MEGILDAWCPVCLEVRKHKLLDPGSCSCTVCGHIEQMQRPLQPGEGVQSGGVPPEKKAAPVESR